MHRFFLEEGYPCQAERCEPHTVKQLQAELPQADEFTTFWTVYHIPGQKPFHAAKGHHLAPNQIVVWYPNGRMYSGYGSTVKAALDDAVKVAWKYMV